MFPYGLKPLVASWSVGIPLLVPMVSSRTGNRDWVASGDGCVEAVLEKPGCAPSYNYNSMDILLWQLKKPVSKMRSNLFGPGQ